MFRQSSDCTATHRPAGVSTAGLSCGSTASGNILSAILEFRRWTHGKLTLDYGEEFHTVRKDFTSFPDVGYVWGPVMGRGRSVRRENDVDYQCAPPGADRGCGAGRRGWGLESKCAGSAAAI